MRYYNIVITNPANGQVMKQYTSFPNNVTDPGALNIEIDIPVAAFASPAGGGSSSAYVRIWGISLADIAQAANLNFMGIAIYAGMQKGLPLANPAQAGLIVEGTIFQSFGNWIGTDMTLDLILQPGTPTTVPPAAFSPGTGSAAPGTGTAANPKNIVVNWKAGTSLAQAIANTLSTAFPGFRQEISISSNLVLAHDEVGYYQSLTQFAQFVKEKSTDVVNPAGATAYQGVDILLTQSTFKVYDGTTQQMPTQIQFQDMIGQPTWIDSLTIQVKCVMRADIGVGDWIKLPPAVVVVTNAAASSLVNLKSAFQGAFMVINVRHVGNFRQPDASDWVTVFECVPTLAATQAQAA